MISRTLRNENDLLRYQLNDIIAREKNQVSYLSLLGLCLHCHMVLVTEDRGKLLLCDLP